MRSLVDKARKLLHSYTMVIAIGVLAVANQTARAELPPLEEVFETEKSIYMTLYAFTRCAALYNTAHCLYCPGARARNSPAKLQ